VEVSLEIGLCVRDAHGAVQCRDTNAWNEYRFRPVKLPAPARLLAGGFYPGAVIAPGDELYPWSNQASHTPPRVFFPETISKLCSAGNFQVAIGHSGKVYEWGDSQRPSMIDAFLRGPRAIPELSAAQQVACGFNHACSLDEHGAIQCWGNGANGQLGRRATCQDPMTCRFEPEVVGIKDSSPVARIAAEGDRSAALTKSGNVYTWGGFYDGACSEGGPCSYAPVHVPLSARAVDLAVGTQHVCALLEDGRVLCWGDNTYGQSAPRQSNGMTIEVPTYVLP
jgi:alpha-tubulin suppressor-like RCC1 family protein